MTTLETQTKKSSSKKKTGIASSVVPKETLLNAYELMCTAKEMCELFELRRDTTSKYVHATSRGHEAIQIAVGLQLQPC